MRRILVIDDDELFLATLERVLKKHDFEVRTAMSGFAALEMVKNEHFDLIISDVRMPEMDGIETLRKITTQTPESRKIVVTGFASDSAPIQAIKLGVDDYLNKPFQMEEFIDSIHRSLERCQESMQQGASRVSLQKKYHDLLKNIIISVEKDAPYFNDHAKDVSDCAEKVGKKLGLPEERLEIIRLGAVLHDLGMYGIKESILEKAHHLSDDEKQKIRESPQVARDLIQGIDGLRPVLPIIYHIRERVDGSGYPDGIAGNDIPLESRILAVTEAFVSLTSPRSYRDAQDRSNALETIKNEQNLRFDPVVVSAFLEVLEEESNGTLEMAAGDKQPGEKNLPTLLALARLYFRSGNLELAESAIHKALEFQGPGTLPVAVKFLTLRSRIELARHHKDAALAMAQEALKAAKKTGDLLSTACAFLQLGSVWAELEKYEEARMAIGKAVDIYDRWGDEFEKTLAHLHRALLLMRLSKKDEASMTECLSVLEAALNSVATLDAHSILIDEGSLFIPLLMLSLEKGLCADEVTRLLALFFRHYPRETLQPFMEGREAHLESIIEILQNVGGKTGRDALISLSSSPLEPVRQKALKALEKSNEEKPLLEIRCFGRFSLLLGNRPIEEQFWQTKQAKHLFIFLALNAGKAFSEDRLMALFWPESPQDKAKQNLHTTITRLRNVFRKHFEDMDTEDYVVKDQEFLKFNSGTNYWLDVQAFEHHFNEGRAFESRGNEQRAMIEYQHAQRIYSGMLLEGVYEDWCSVKREEAAENHLEALARLSSFYLARDNAEAAMRYARMILEEDRHSSRGMHLFMRAALKLGNRDGALKKYYEYSRSLEKEQGIPPDPEVMKLYLQIKEGIPQEDGD
jgi:putative two-component system response regulator